MSRLYLSRQEAEKAGRLVDTSVYPWRIRQTRGADPHTPPAPIVRTDIEAKLGEVLIEMEWSGSVDVESGIGIHPVPACPFCGAPHDEGAHKAGCKLADALRIFRGGDVQPGVTQPGAAQPIAEALTVDQEIDLIEAVVDLAEAEVTGMQSRLDNAAESAREARKRPGLSEEASELLGRLAELAEEQGVSYLGMQLAEISAQGRDGIEQMKSRSKKPLLSPSP